MSPSRIAKGQKIIIKQAYSVRGFLLRPDEPISSDYAQFSRDGREPKLVQLHKGEALSAVTNANDDGFVYAQHALDGKSWACVLLPDSYLPA